MIEVCAHARLCPVERERSNAICVSLPVKLWLSPKISGLLLFFERLDLSSHPPQFLASHPPQEG